MKYGIGRGMKGRSIINALVVHFRKMRLTMVGVVIVSYIHYIKCYSGFLRHTAAENGLDFRTMVNGPATAQ